MTFSARTGTEFRLLFRAVAVNALLYALVLILSTPGFEAIDDVGLASLVSGRATGAPTSEIPPSNILLGSLLASLYGWTDRVNWYTAYLLAAHFATMTGLLYAFLRMEAGRTSLALFAIGFAQFEWMLLLRLHFGSTAVMAGVVGMLLVLGSTAQSPACPARQKGATGNRLRARMRQSARFLIDCVNRQPRLPAVFGGLLIVLSGLMRPASLGDAALLLVPLCAYEAMRHRFVALGRMGLCLAAAVAAIGCDRWHYAHDPRWGAFHEYDAASAALHSSPTIRYDEHSRFFFDRIGWTANDWRMFRSGFAVDPEFYSRQRLKTILDRFHESHWLRDSGDRSRAQSLKRIFPFRALMYANALLAVLLTRGSKLLVLLIGIGQCLFVELSLVALSHDTGLAPRTTLPAFFAATAILFWLEREVAWDDRYAMPLPPRRWARRLAAACAVLFCPVYAGLCSAVAARQLETSEANAHAQRGFTALTRAIGGEYVDKNPKCLFLNWEESFPSQIASPFDDVHGERRIPMIPLGRWLDSPPVQNLLRMKNISDLCREAFANPSVYLFANPTQIKFLTQFAREHYQQPIGVAHNRFYLTDTDSEISVGSRVYQMVPAPAPAPAAAPAAAPGPALTPNRDEHDDHRP